MLSRLTGLFLVIISGLIMLNSVARFVLNATSSQQEGVGPADGHQAAYEAGRGLGQAMAFVFAIFMMLAGLFLLFARSYGPRKGTKRRKPRQIATPAPLDDDWPSP